MILYKWTAVSRAQVAAQAEMPEDKIASCLSLDLLYLAACARVEGMYHWMDFLGLSLKPVRSCQGWQVHFWRMFPKNQKDQALLSGQTSRPSSSGVSRGTTVS